MSSPQQQLQTLWGWFGTSASKRWLFSRLFGWVVPYSGTIGADILVLEPGYVKARLRDRRRVRNHLNSIHALALANFGEVCSGLALHAAMPENVRGIVTRLEIDYAKKARGVLEAESRLTFPNVDGPTPLLVTTEIKDAKNSLVATTKIHWLLDIKQSANEPTPSP